MGDLVSIVLLFTLPTLVTLAFVLIRKRFLARRYTFTAIALVVLNVLHFTLPNLLGAIGISFHPFFATPTPASQNAWALVVFAIHACIYVLCLKCLSYVPIFRTLEREKMP